MSTTDATLEQLILCIFAKIFVDESILRRPNLPQSISNLPSGVTQEHQVPLARLLDAFASASVFKDKGQVIAAIMTFKPQGATMTIAQNFEAESNMIVNRLISIRDLLLDTRANPRKRWENRDTIANIMYNHHMPKLAQRFNKRIGGYEKRYKAIRQEKMDNVQSFDRLRADIAQIKDLISAKDTLGLVQKMKIFVGTWRSYIVDSDADQLDFRKFTILSGWDEIDDEETKDSNSECQWTSHYVVGN